MIQKPPKNLNAFTLFELIVVLSIISAMVAVILPFAARSKEGLKIIEQSHDIEQTIRYAIALTQDQHRPVKFVINIKNKSYHLEQADENGYFKLIESFLVAVRYIDNKIHIHDADGFRQEAEELSLILDPARPWPKAQFSISTRDMTKTIKINTRNVEIEETSI